MILKTTTKSLFLINKHILNWSNALINMFRLGYTNIYILK